MQHSATLINRDSNSRPLPEFMSTKQLCAFLNVSYVTIKKAIDEGTLSPIQLGAQKYLWNPREVLEALETRRVKPSQKPQ